MANPVSKDDAEITATPKQLPMESEKAQCGPHVARGCIVLIPHPSDDPRDPLVCLHVHSSLIACERHYLVSMQLQFSSTILTYTLD